MAHPLLTLSAAHSRRPVLWIGLAALAILLVFVGRAALLAPPLAAPASAVLAALALGLLAWSFALDFAQLLRA